MPLVWKGVEVNHNSASSHSSNIGSSHNQSHESRRTAEFKFVQGRPKRKRKPKTNSSYEIAENQGCFSVATSPAVEATQVWLPASVAPSPSDSTLSPLLDCIVEEAMPEGVVDDAWDVQLRAGASIDNLDATWAPPEQLAFSPNAGWDEADPGAASSSGLTVFGSVEEVERCNFGEFVLSPTILYQDLAHKYNYVLEMCKYT